MQTTLNKIWNANHAEDGYGWDKLLINLGKSAADDEPLTILEILNSNGLYDALWALRTVDGHDKIIRIYGCWCASRVVHLTKDDRSYDAIRVSMRYADGMVTKEELETAWLESWNASRTEPMDTAMLDSMAAARSAARTDSLVAVRYVAVRVSAGVTSWRVVGCTAASQEKMFRLVLTNPDEAEKRMRKDIEKNLEKI